MIYYYFAPNYMHIFEGSPTKDPKKVKIVRSLFTLGMPSNVFDNEEIYPSSMTEYPMKEIKRRLIEHFFQYYQYNKDHVINNYFDEGKVLYK